MSKAAARPAPADWRERQRALDSSRSILVQAPAGSGKTTLLTERFLTLLGEVDEPGQIVAITFTNATAAEMRNRILDELRKTEPSALARRALDRSNRLGWNLLDLPAQLRIATIDSFCRELALQQPLLAGLGGGLEVASEPDELYRRAARLTLGQLDVADSEVGAAVETLLRWRDNSWQELENLLVKMLAARDKWMQEFLLSKDANWEDLRLRLERPFAKAVGSGLSHVSRLLDQVPGAREEALLLARFACSQPNGDTHRALAELADFPVTPFLNHEELEEAHHALNGLARLVLTLDCLFRKRIDKNHGFPAERKTEKSRLTDLICRLDAVPGLEAALGDVLKLPPARYPEDDWQILRASFTLLRYAAAQLKVVFAEAAAVDFIEVAQIAGSVLESEDGLPSDAALAVADGIRHLLVDEFQDTSRRQHQLLARLIAAWPEREGRTCFAVGDPMQSIYFFRNADAELFSRVQSIGIEIPDGEPMTLDFVPLSANFRAVPDLVCGLNEAFATIFAEDDGSGVTFGPAVAAREDRGNGDSSLKLHLEFVPQNSANRRIDDDQPTAEMARDKQTRQIVKLIQSHFSAMERARAAGEKYRVAVLSRTRASLAPIAQALHEAMIPFRAVDVEQLGARPEVLDALALGRALLNPQDRVAWLGVLRAPWCGLSLEDLHRLTSADDSRLLALPVHDLVVERIGFLSSEGRTAVERVLSTIGDERARFASESTTSTGTWLQQIWRRLGGEDCCDATARANLDLLWACLDRLPNGQQDLIGPALPTALEKLTALPDPQASSNCGVQLMTIHKSKGLEFEVVIVPDLQAGTAGASQKLLSWLERGVRPDEAGDWQEAGSEITEFLVAPLPSKGADSGLCKRWVDCVYRDRESQEMRRILYVAATRACEELHLFARPAYKVEANGELSLLQPNAGLLRTAWPAFEGETRARFEDWKRSQIPIPTVEERQGEIESIAAESEGSLHLARRPADTSTVRPNLIRRLPADYRAEGGHASILTEHGMQDRDAMASEGVFSPMFLRHEGGMHSRVLGTAVHSLFEDLARLRIHSEMGQACEALRRFVPQVAAQIRTAGIGIVQAQRAASDALQIAVNAAQDPLAEWILAPHREAQNEVRWTGVIDGALTNVRVDRVFRAGLEPQSKGDSAWWIVDYKTAQSEEADSASVLARLRMLFAPQLEAYARVLRNLQGANAVVRAGLYYPRMRLFDWWVV